MGDFYEKFHLTVQEGKKILQERDELFQKFFQGFQNGAENDSESSIHRLDEIRIKIVEHAIQNDPEFYMCGMNEGAMYALMFVGFEIMESPEKYASQPFLHAWKEQCHTFKIDQKFVEAKKHQLSLTQQS
jgi:hypothetical protein